VDGVCLGHLDGKSSCIFRQKDQSLNQLWRMGSFPLVGGYKQEIATYLSIFIDGLISVNVLLFSISSYCSISS